MRLLFLVVFGWVFIYFSKNFLAERQFYRRNGWDFSLDNPSALRFQRGEDDDRPLSNKSRLAFGYPVFMVCGGIGFIGLYLTH